MFFHDAFINDICNENSSGKFEIAFAGCVIQSGCPRGTIPPDKDGSRLKGNKTRELMHAQHPDCFVCLREGSDMVPYAEFAFALARSSGARLLLGGCQTNQRTVFHLGPFPYEVFIHKERKFQKLEGKRVSLTMYRSGREPRQLKPDGVPLAGRPATSHTSQCSVREPHSRRRQGYTSVWF